MSSQSSKNYDAGKKQEKEADTYMRSQGFERPSSKQRKVIQKALFQTKGAEINTTGFDLVSREALSYCDDVGSLVSYIAQNQLVLYEMKSAGSRRKTKVSESWEGFGFTFSQNEDDNWIELGDDGYKFVFLNMSAAPVRYQILNRAEWDNDENRRSYNTRSVFIKHL